MAQQPPVEIGIRVRVGPSIVAVSRVDRELHRATAGAQSFGTKFDVLRVRDEVPLVVEGPHGDSLQLASGLWIRLAANRNDGREALGVVRGSHWIIGSDATRVR